MDNTLLWVLTNISWFIVCLFAVKYFKYKSIREALGEQSRRHVKELSESIDRAKLYGKKEGIEEGVIAGIEEGKRIGLEEGENIGFVKGKEVGFKEGRKLPKGKDGRFLPRKKNKN